MVENGLSNTLQSELRLALNFQQSGEFPSAIAIYRRILANQPGNLAVNMALGVLLHTLDEHGEAVSCLEKVVEQQPRNFEARFKLAVSLHKLKRLDDAAEHFESIIESSQLSWTKISDGNLAGTYSNLGNVYRDLRRGEDAEHCLVKALDLQPQMPEALNSLGALFYTQGRIDEAAGAFRKAIQVRPEFAKAHRQLAMCIGHRNHDDEIKAMERLHEADETPDADKGELAFGLGKAFDDLKDYPRAMAYWLQGNWIRRKLAPYDVQDDLHIMTTLERIFDAHRLSTAPKDFAAQPTPIFIIGMPRSGTSLTEQIVASHSMVHGAGELETVANLARDATNNFPEDLSELQATDWQRLAEDYLKYVQRLSDGAPFVVDKMPHNFLYAGMIAMMFPTAKILHCRRDPMDNCLSCFTHYFVESGLAFTDDLTDLGVYYRHYAKLMTHWHRVLPGRIYDVTYERLVAEPEAEIRRLLEFCGLPFEAACLAFHQTDRLINTASAAQVKRPIYRDSVARWQRYGPALDPLRTALEGAS